MDDHFTAMELVVTQHNNGRVWRKAIGQSLWDDHCHLWLSGRVFHPLLAARRLFLPRFDFIASDFEDRVPSFMMVFLRRKIIDGYERILVRMSLSYAVSSHRRVHQPGRSSEPLETIRLIYR